MEGCWVWDLKATRGFHVSDVGTHWQFVFFFNSRFKSPRFTLNDLYFVIFEGSMDAYCYVHYNSLVTLDYYLKSAIFNPIYHSF